MPLSYRWVTMMRGNVLLQCPWGLPAPSIGSDIGSMQHRCGPCVGVLLVQQSYVTYVPGINININTYQYQVPGTWYQVVRMCCCTSTLWYVF